MKKVKRVLASIICFTMLLSIRPVYAAESRVFTPPCDHKVVYITAVDQGLVPIDDYYHCSKSQEVTKCAQCDTVISRGQIFLGDLKHHHFKSEGNEWVCDCGAKKDKPSLTSGR